MAIKLMNEQQILAHAEKIKQEKIKQNDKPAPVVSTRDADLESLYADYAERARYICDDDRRRIAREYDDSKKEEQEEQASIAAQKQCPSPSVAIDNVPAVNTVGRPTMLQSGKPYKVYLDKDTVNKLRAIGYGNLSLGIRIAADQYIDTGDKH